MKNFTKIINSNKNVFSKNDLKNILEFKNSKALDWFLYRAKKNSFLKNPVYGIYTFKEYDFFEFASKLKKKSYISLETVLKKESVIYQYYDNIFLVSDNTFQKNILWQNYIFFKIKDSILLNPIWIEFRKNYMIASVERAICDKIYLSKNYYFDDLSWINFKKLEEISKIYNNRVILEVNKLIKDENK